MEDNEVRILVVDDNQENLRVASNYLKEKNYKLALALDGESALKILSYNNVDLVLLDVMMPGIDGFEVCRRIKQIDSCKNIPIIFLTAKIDADFIEKAFDAGGVDYISKPFKKQELFARICSHIQLKKIKNYLDATLSDWENYPVEVQYVLTSLLQVTKL